MSQAGPLDTSGSGPIPPEVATEYIADVGSAVPVANQLEIFGDIQAAGTTPVETTGSGNTITTVVQLSQANALSSSSNAGLASFDSTSFGVDANGFVTFSGTTTGIDSINVDAHSAPGTDPVVPDGAGLVTMTGRQVPSLMVGANVLRTNSIAANSMLYEIQQAGAVAAESTNYNGVAHFDSAYFTVSNGFVTPTAALTTDLHVARFIVSAGGASDGANYTDLPTAYADAIAAGAPQTVFLQPGTYVITTLELSDGIDIVAFVSDQLSPNVTIQGRLQFSAAGTVSIAGINFASNGAHCIRTENPGTGTINISNCNFEANNFNPTILCNTTLTSRFNLYNCTAELGTGSFFSDTSTGISNFYNCIVNNTANNTTLCTLAGTNNFYDCKFFSLVNYGNNSAITNYYNTLIDCSAMNILALWDNSLGGTGRLSAYNCVFKSGTATCIEFDNTSGTYKLVDCSINSSNADAIFGTTGSFSYSNLTFDGSSSLMNITNQVPLITSNDAIKIKTPGAYPYTTIPQDALILVDTSVARTITPLASPTTGQRHIIKDSTGTAGANNISITPSGKNIDGVATKTISTNYGSMTIVYGGSEWKVV